MKPTANPRVRLAAAATLVLTGVGVTAGCAAQAVPVSDVSVVPPSAMYTSAPQASTPAGAEASASPTTPAAPTPPAPTTTPAGPTSAAVEDCGQGAALTRPAQLVLACADQGLWAKELAWSSWSATSATATGIISWHVCTPDCAQSTKWDSTSAQVTLTDPVTEPGGRILFTKLELKVTGPTPAGFMRDETFNVAPMN